MQVKIFLEVSTVRFLKYELQEVTLVKHPQLP